MPGHVGQCQQRHGNPSGGVCTTGVEAFERHGSGLCGRRAAPDCWIKCRRNLLQVRDVEPNQSRRNCFSSGNSYKKGRLRRWWLQFNHEGDRSRELLLDAWRQERHGCHRQDRRLLLRSVIRISGLDAATAVDYSIEILGRLWAANHQTHKKATTDVLATDPARCGAGSHSSVPRASRLLRSRYRSANRSMQSAGQRFCVDKRDATGSTRRVNCYS